MANGWIEAKKGSPCPICGTGDYCAHHDAEDGYGYVYLCKRYQDSRVICPGSDTPGKTDGEFYLLIAESDSGFGIYRNARDVQTAESMGVHVWRKGANDNSAVLGPGSSKKELVPVGINEVAPDYVLDSFYRALLSEYPLTNEHRAYLHGECWSDELINSSNLASFPCEDWRRYYQSKNGNTPKCFLKSRANATAAVIAKVGAEPVGVPGFYQDTNKKTGEKYWTFSARSGLVFPVYNEQHQIVRLRIRMDYWDAANEYERDSKGLFILGDDNRKRYLIPFKGMYREEFNGEMLLEKDEKYRCKGKYRWVTSFSGNYDYENGILTNRLENGTESGNICGLYTKASDNCLIVLATEGEKKAIKGNDSLNMPFIVVPGVSSFANLFVTRTGKNILEYLVSKGCKYIAVAYDADKHTNPSVLGAEQQFIEMIRSYGLIPLIVEWDSAKGKGLDDALNNGAELYFKEI